MPASNHQERHEERFDRFRVDAYYKPEAFELKIHSITAFLRRQFTDLFAIDPASRSLYHRAGSVPPAIWEPLTPTKGRRGHGTTSKPSFTLRSARRHPVETWSKIPVFLQ